MSLTYVNTLVKSVASALMLNVQNAQVSAKVMCLLTFVSTFAKSAAGAWTEIVLNAQKSAKVIMNTAMKQR